MASIENYFYPAGVIILMAVLSQSVLGSSVMAKSHFFMPVPCRDIIILATRKLFEALHSSVN